MKFSKINKIYMNIFYTKLAIYLFNGYHISYILFYDFIRLTLINEKIKNLKLFLIMQNNNTKFKPI